MRRSLSVQSAAPVKASQAAGSNAGVSRLRHRLLEAAGVYEPGQCCVVIEPETARRTTPMADPSGSDALDSATTSNAQRSLEDRAAVQSRTERGVSAHRGPCRACFHVGMSALSGMRRAYTAGATMSPQLRISRTEPTDGLDPPREGRATLSTRSSRGSTRCPR